jgi:hypothetical protein
MGLWWISLGLAAASLEAWYRFSEVISDIQYDFSGNSNHCVVYGNPLTLGPHGLYFNGVNDYADMPGNSAAPTDLDLTPPFTFTIWMYRKYNTSPTFMGVLALSTPSDLNLKFSTNLSANRYPELTLTTSAGSTSVTASSISVMFGKL